LVIAERPGFGASPPLPRGDFEVEAGLFAELLGDGAHLVGHSYGAVVALFAAARRPEAVLSLTVSEPGALKLAGTPAGEELIARGELLYAARDSIPPADFLRLFRGGTGSSRATPEELPEELLRGAELAMEERPPWEADVPLDVLAAAGFPVLAISGGHSPVFEAVCDTVAERLGGERARIEGRGHNIPETGTPYNERLERFLEDASND
jgi:pimeloyl-ACP methyl ester carboxylesterase